MLRKMYDSYCRSCCQASCDPRAIGICLVIVGVALGAGRVIAQHESQIVHAFFVAAASVLAVAAGALLIWAMATVVRATGQHAAPACSVPRRRARAVPVPPAGTVPVPEEAPAPYPASAPVGYTWKINPPAQPDPVAAEEAAMARAADVLGSTARRQS